MPNKASNPCACKSLRTTITNRLDIGQAPRIVDPFSPLTNQKNIKVKRPPKSDFQFAHPKVGHTKFKELCQNGEIPVHIGRTTGTSGWELVWQVDTDKLDFEWFLPIFLEGLLEVEHPYNFLSLHGCIELMYIFRCEINDLLPILVPIFKDIFSSRVTEIIVSGLNVFKHLIFLEPRIGPSLITYYKIILPRLNLYYQHFDNLDGETWYGQSKTDHVHDSVQQTLEYLEKAGGEESYQYIKQYVPYYQSVLHNL